MSKISAYTSLSSAAGNDLLPVVDVNDTTMASTGTTKKVTLAGLLPVDWVNVVTQYQADPSGVTDSTARILSAIAGLPATGGVVYFPAGTYKISSVLAIGSGVTLTGDGPQNTIFHQTSTTANGIYVTEASTYVTDVTISNLQILGPSTGSGIGIYGSADSDTQGIFRLKISNVIVTSMGGNGIEIHNPILTVLEQVQSSFNNANGIYLLGVPVGTSCTLISCYAKSNGSRGYYLSNMAYSFLGGCAADFNQNGYVLNVCSGVTISGCGAESQTVDNFVLSGGQGNTMTGGWVYQNAHYALNVLGSESGLSVLGFTENSPTGGAVKSIITAAGVTALMVNYEVITAVSFAAGTTSLSPAGVFALTSGSLTLSPNIPLTVNGSIDISGAGYGLEVKEGSNCKQGTVVLNGTTAVVAANTSVTASSRILMTHQSISGTPGVPYISARTPGTSFSVTSTAATDLGTVAYEIFEPG